MEKNFRSRLFTLISYLDQDEILSTCIQKNIRNYAFILHDKDITADGNTVSPHYHILLRLQNPTTVSAVRKLFPSRQNTLAQVIKGDTIFNYLTHDTFADKYQYSEESIVSNDLTYWRYLSPSDSRTVETVSLINDLLNGVDLYTMMCTYGRDFVLNINKYKAFAELLRPQLHTCDEKLNELALEHAERAEIARSFSQMEIIE